MATNVIRYETSRFTCFCRCRAARLIAELHRQATANDLLAQDKAIRADITKRQETVFWMSIAGAFIVALGSILALLAMM